MKEFKPNYLLDEQMYFDAEKTLLYQIREEAKETNNLLRKLVKQQEEPVEDQQAEKVEKKPKKAPASEKE
jgi:ribosomal protein S6